MGLPGLYYTDLLYLIGLRGKVVFGGKTDENVLQLRHEEGNHYLLS